MEADICALRTGTCRRHPFLVRFDSLEMAFATADLQANNRSPLNVAMMTEIYIKIWIDEQHSMEL